MPVGVLAHPVMPLINDSEESLDGVCAGRRAKRSIVLQRRSAVPEALRTAGVLPVSRTAFPAPGAALPRALRKERVPARPLSGNDQRAGAAHSGAPQLAARPAPNGLSSVDDQLELFPALSKDPGTACYFTT